MVDASPIAAGLATPLMMDSDLQANAELEQSFASFLAQSAATDGPSTTGVDFELFGTTEEPDTSYPRADPATEAGLANDDNDILGDGATASPTALWQPTEGESSAHSSSTSALETPALGFFGTPDEGSMSTQPTPLFPSQEMLSSFESSGVALFDTQYSPTEAELNIWGADVNGHQAPASAAMRRSATSRSGNNNTPVSPTAYAGVTKNRKRSKPVKDLNPSEGKTEEERKKIKNTLAARQSRARKVARMEALEDAASECHRKALMIQQYVLDHGMTLPPEMMVPETMNFPGADGERS